MKLCTRINGHKYFDQFVIPYFAESAKSFFTPMNLGNSGQNNSYDPSRAVLVCLPFGAGCGEDLSGGVGEGVGGYVLVAGDVHGDLLQGS